MTVDEAIKELTRISEGGKGSFPLHFMDIDHGVTYAKDIAIKPAEKYDGRRVWIWTTKMHVPARSK